MKLNKEQTITKGKHYIELKAHIEDIVSVEYKTAAGLETNEGTLERLQSAHTVWHTQTNGRTGCLHTWK